MMRWECYDGQAKFLDELKGRQVIARKRGYGPDYVNLFVKHHKEMIREFARQRDIYNPINAGLDKWGLDRRLTLEERVRKKIREETRVQMQVLNEHVVALCARIGCSEEHAAKVARARYEEKKLDEYRSRAGRTVQSSIVLSDEGDEDEDDTGRLSELIALVEVGLQAEEDEDGTGRLSELIALAEAGLQAEEDEDATGRLSELIALAEAGL
ncbi:uncharacterized protein [Miscanthus floridulus]|uniref:uncharacterized protein n=1 Tax=Miscanthus floridulus TaxID=154761 RepID=UPI00345B263F